MAAQIIGMADGAWRLPFFRGFSEITPLLTLMRNHHIVLILPRFLVSGFLTISLKPQNRKMLNRKM
jgi:hypothetical protein